MQNIPITLATFVKNEAHCLENMLQSVNGYVHELIIVDTGSTDGTQDIARKYTNRVYEIGFTDFGKIRTATAHLSSSPWILMLDADETLERPDLLQKCIQITKGKENKPVEAIAFPRKRWLDLTMTQQTELEAYPDWQVRLFQNVPHHIFRRSLHEEFHGGIVTEISEGPCIHHFQDVFKNTTRNKIREELYSKLASFAGVTVHGGKPIC